VQAVDSLAALSMEVTGEMTKGWFENAEERYELLTEVGQVVICARMSDLENINPLAKHV
jgi:hypothetical protein